MKTVFILFPLLLITATNCYAIAGSMQVRGHGDVYYLGFIKVYEASLLTERTVDTRDVLNPGISKCLKLVYDMALTSENFIEGANTVLRRQHADELLNKHLTELETLHRGYQPVKEGDNYLLCYDAANATTTLTLNGEDLVSVISEDFSTLYFGIWLSPDQPIDKKLQKTLVRHEK